MAEPINLMAEQQRLTALLSSCISEYPKQGKRAAEAERDYKIALSKRTLELKQCGYPVTIIQDITRGDPEVAEKRFTRDVEREYTKALLEKINVLKLQLRIIQENIKMDYHQGG